METKGQKTDMNLRALIFSTPDHPLHPILKKSFMDKEKEKTFFFSLHPGKMVEKLPALPQTDFDIIWDFTLFPQDVKTAFLSLVEEQTSCPILSEGSVNWGESLLLAHPALSGIFSCGFFLPRHKFEFYMSSGTSPALKEKAIDFFSDLSLTPVWVSTPGAGFYYPRTLSMIVNEAYFALEEELSSPEEMDEAMKYGVNHPLGPFEWAEKIGPRKIVFLLDLLLQFTGDPRYRVSPRLRLEAQKKEKEKKSDH